MRYLPPQNIISGALWRSPAGVGTSLAPRKGKGMARLLHRLRLTQPPDGRTKVDAIKYHESLHMD